MAEHNPPHIHAIYGEDMAAVDIQTGEALSSGIKEFLPLQDV